MVKFGNIYYFIYIFIAIVYFLILYFSIRHQNKETQKRVLLILLFLNLGLHFSKLLFEPYRSGLPGTIRKITFENICAGSTLSFPFIFMCKKRSLKDYMYYFGIFGGLGALLIPTEALGESPLKYDVIRFYLCHMTLVIVPVMAAILNIHRPSYHDIWKTILVFLAVETTILINEVLLIKIGLVKEVPGDFFDIKGRNSSFIFGPNDFFTGIIVVITALVPSFCIINTKYLPIIWMLIPLWIYVPILCFLFCYPWNKQLIKEDLEKIKIRWHERKRR